MGAYWSNLLPLEAKISLMPRVELHGKMGELSHLKSSRSQEEHLFPILDLYFNFIQACKFHWHLGIGAGMTEASDSFLVNNILSLEL